MLDSELPVAAACIDRVRLHDPVFISDLHLSAAQPATGAAFERFCAEIAPRYRELLILGDLFEFWAGDDDASPTGQRVGAALRRVASAGTAVWLMHGNRDLLLGPAFAAACGAQLLADPVHAELAIASDVHADPHATPLPRSGSARLLLAHGDQYCTLDLPYQAFRAQVRDPAWQRAFLARPLAERQALIGAVRAQSEAGKQVKSSQIMDVTPAAVAQALHDSGIATLIHGHTHRPGSYPVTGSVQSAQRWVLPDWDLDAEASAPRGGYLDLRLGTPALHSLS